MPSRCENEFRNSERVGFVHKDNIFREYCRKKGSVCFRCTVKTDKARIETKDVTVVAKYGDHDHSDNVSYVTAVALRVSCKRKVSKNNLSKILRTALESAVVTSADNQVTSYDVECLLRVFILCMTDTDDVAPLELQVAVL